MSAYSANFSTSPKGPTANIHLPLPPQRSTSEQHELERLTYSVSKPANGGSPGTSPIRAASVHLELSSETGGQGLGRAPTVERSEVAHPLSAGASPSVHTHGTNLPASTLRTELEVGYRSAGLDFALDSLRMPTSMDPLRPGAVSVPRSSPSSNEDPFDALVAEAVARSTRAAAELARTRLGLTLTLSNTGLGSGSNALAAPTGTSTGASTASPSKGGLASGSPLTKEIGGVGGRGGGGSGSEPEPGSARSGGDRERPALKAALKLHFDDNVTSASEIGTSTSTYSCLY